MFVGNLRMSLTVTIKILVVYHLFQIGYIYSIADPKLDKYKLYNLHVLVGAWINIILAD